MIMNPKYLMDTFNIDPKKSLGQNFLHDPNALEKIVHTAGITSQDTVLEIGPGTGALTVYLAQTAAQVIAVEIDDRLMPILEQQLRDFSNVQVIHADILNVDIDDLVYGREFIVVANLPYYITSAILRHLLEGSHKPKRLILTVQQEVAERLVAPPGDLSLLAISVLYYGQPRIVTRLAPAAFWPRPRNSIGAGLGISHPQAGAILETAGVDPMRRAETLTLEEWAAITRVVDIQYAHRLA